LQEIEAGIRDLLEPYLKRLEDPAPAPAGSRPVSLIALAFPLPERERQD